VNLSNIGA